MVELAIELHGPTSEAVRTIGMSTNDLTLTPSELHIATEIRDALYPRMITSTRMQSAYVCTLSAMPYELNNLSEE